MRPINKSLIRYQTILGVEKELFFFALLVSGIIPYSVRNWISLVIGAIIWFIFIFFTPIMQERPYLFQNNL